MSVKSWEVVEHDRRLLVLPLISLLATIATAVLIFGPFAVWAAHSGSRWPFFLAVLVSAYPFSFISTYFGVAFVSQAALHLRGEPASVSDGIACANERLGSIAAWALLTTLVGLAIKALERVRGGAAATAIAGWLLGAAWSLATFFVIPVLALRGGGPIEAAKASVQTVRKRWGEGITGATVIGAVFGILLLPIVIVGVIGWTSFNSSPLFGATVLAIAIVLGLTVLATQAAVESLFRLVLFQYAEEDVVAAPFDRADLESAFMPRRRSFFRNS